jgi:hypothetical protein
MSAKFIRFVIIAAESLCWAGAASSIIWGWPDEGLRELLLAAAVSLLLVDRTSPGPSMRRTARIFYEQGIHDTVAKVRGAQRRGEDGTLRAG